MNRAVLSLLVMLGSFACGTAWAQDQPQASRTVTEFHNATGPFNPARVIVTQRQEDGRTVETRIVEAPSINGGYEPISETEQETIRVDANTVRVVQRWFSPGAGNRQPFQVTEEERRTQPGGRESVVRTTSTLDLSGHWQAQERDIEEAVSTAPDTKETKKTVLGVVAGSLVPVQKSEETEHRSGNVVEVQRKLLTPNGSGNFQVFEVQETVATQTKDGQTTEKKTYRDDGRGQIAIIEQTAGSGWKNANNQSGTMSRTYSTFVPGAAPDGQLHLVQQRNVSATTSPDSSTRTEQEVQAVNPGAPQDGLRTTTLMIEVSQPLGRLRTETHKEMRVLDVGGSFPLIWVTDSRETKEIH